MLSLCFHVRVTLHTDLFAAMRDRGVADCYEPHLEVIIGHHDDIKSLQRHRVRIGTLISQAR